MPGRRTPPIPDRLSPQWAIRAFTSVPKSCPAAGWTTRPAGLSMTITSSSSWTTLSAIASASGAARAGGGTSIETSAPLPIFELGVEHRGAVDGHPSLADERLQPAARQVGPGIREQPVEPPGPPS